MVVAYNQFSVSKNTHIDDFSPRCVLGVRHVTDAYPLPCFSYEWSRLSKNALVFALRAHGYELFTLLPW